MGWEKRTIVNLVIFLYIFLLTANFVFAVGMSGKIFYEKIFFEPGLKKTYTYYVLSNTNREMVHTITIMGDEEITPYFIAEPNKLLLKPNEQKQFILKINFPQTLKPGKYKASVCAIESETRTKVENGSGIGARTGVCAIFEVYSLIPGKNIEAKLLEIKNVDYGENSSIKMNIINVGNETVNIKPYVEIKKDNETIKKIKLKNIYLLTKVEKTIEREFSTEGINEGEYNVLIVLEYGNKTTLLNGTFSIGKPTIRIIDFTKQLEKSKLNVFKIRVKNLWNKEMKGVFAKIKIMDQNNNTIKEVTSNVIDLNAFEEKELEAYLETGSYEGLFNILIEVSLPEGKITEYGTIEIRSKINIIFILAVILGTIILIIILFFIIRIVRRNRKKLKKSKLKKYGKKKIERKKKRKK